MMSYTLHVGIAQRKAGHKLGMVPHACNPSCLGGREKGSWFEANPGKKFVRSHLNL
jgi:hypothetical protein